LFDKKVNLVDVLVVVLELGVTDVVGVLLLEIIQFSPRNPAYKIHISVGET